MNTTTTEPHRMAKDVGPTWTNLETTLGERFILPANEWSVAAQNEKELLTLTHTDTRTWTHGRGNAVLQVNIDGPLRDLVAFLRSISVARESSTPTGLFFRVDVTFLFLHLPFCRNFSLH